MEVSVEQKDVESAYTAHQAISVSEITNVNVRVGVNQARLGKHSREINLEDNRVLIDELPRR